MTAPDIRDYLDEEESSPEAWERWTRAQREYEHHQALQEEADEQRHLERLIEDGGEFFVERTK